MKKKKENFLENFTTGVKAKKSPPLPFVRLSFLPFPTLLQDKVVFVCFFSLGSHPVVLMFYS